MLEKEVKKKYKFTIKDLLKTLDDYGIIPEDYIEIKKDNAEKPKNIAENRFQNPLDKDFTFGYKRGSIQDETMTPEVKESIELFDEYKSSRQIWAQGFQEALEFRAGAQWSHEEKIY